ncbi:LOW QUALITY PROTEIN: hypothetical protein ACHAW6_000940 [Cyclotella cf. meneghiniana]
MKLHNFCINNDNKSSPSTFLSMREQSATRQFAIVFKQDGLSGIMPVKIDDNGIPTDLSGSGHHFVDFPVGVNHRLSILEIHQ